eukprot:XP_002510778.2 uncharacterized protein LOC8277420 [Ricinus communis]
MEETRKPTELEKPKQQQNPPSKAHSNKRKFTNVNLHNSSYFKVRALLRQLRPQFIQVLQAPDFRNCKASHELQIQMKHLMNLYRQMTVEIEPLEKPLPKCQLLSAGNGFGRQSWDTNQVVKSPELVQPKESSRQGADKKPPTYFDSQVKLDDSCTRKSYIVGGSACGWNFITFKGGNPVHCGVKKESYRNTHTSKMSGTGASSHIS